MNFEAMKVDIERTVVAEIREQQEAARRAMAAQWGQARAQLRVDEANRRAEADRVDYWKTGADAEKARAVEHLAALQRQQEARRHELQATLSDMPGIDAAPKSTRINGPVPVFEDAKWSTLGGFSSDRGRGLLTVAGGDHRLGRFGAPVGEA